jgi:cardiolipin synthase (CMP-forming)
VWGELATAPNVLSLTRLAMIPALWVAAFRGDARLVGIGMALAFASDVLDGWLARRLSAVSSIGSRLDSLADNILQPCAAIWLLMLRPQFVHDHAAGIIAGVLVYAASLTVGLVRFRRFGNLHLRSSRVSAVTQYVFIVQALVGTTPSVVLLYLALATWLVSSTETLVLQIVHSEVDERMGSLVRMRRSSGRS